MLQLQDNFRQVTPEVRALNSAFATVAFDSERHILRANNRFLRLFGYELEELVARDDSVLFHPSADREMAEALWQRICAGDAQTAEAHCVTKSGASLWLKTTYAPIMANCGTVEQIVAIVEDVSRQKLERVEIEGQIAAIHGSQAVVQFSGGGTIIDANRNFLDILGYTRDELIGRHHRLLLPAAYAESADYDEFWSKLSSGIHQGGEYLRIAKDGRNVILQATYTPILDPAGDVLKIVGYATDITAERFRQAEYEWQLAAVHKSHAVIVFDLNGAILQANDKFLEAVGYSLDEVEGRHHRMFVDPAYAHSTEYAAFWRMLKRGEYQAGLFHRLGKGGRDIWLQATYNPVFDIDGNPTKIVKYATVVTDERREQAENQGQIAAIHKAQMVVSFDLDGTILDANDNFLDAMGYHYVDVRGRHHRMFVDPEEANSHGYADFWKRLAGGQHHVGEYRRLARDGAEVWLQATYNPIFDLSGQPFKIVKYATDITRKRAERADIRGQIEAINRSQAAITLTLDGDIIEANANFLEMFGYAANEIKGQNHAILVEPGATESADYKALWNDLRAGRFVSGMYKRIGKDKREIWLQSTYNPIFDPNGQPVKIVKFSSDVTSNVALAEAYEDARRKVQYDVTTALPNRVRMIEFAENALAVPGARVALLYLDIDFFKTINDSFGHDVGDRVLGEVADRLRRSLSEDQLAARIGGDEFVIVAPEIDDAELEDLCRRIMKTAAEPIPHDQGELRPTISIGVAVSPGDGISTDELLRCADAGLYRSKQRGRATYTFYSAELSERMSLSRKTVDDMRRGLAADEFFLLYQPKVDTGNCRILGVEALVRWSHPERGRMNPIDFIPVAERSGLIVPLGTWVLREACAAVAKIPDINVSVNVSTAQLKHDTFPDLVAAILEETGLDPSRLEIEITESLLIEDAARAKSILDRLKSLGLRLALDDFGTGYSSLSYLRNFPFDIIKIDRQFIADLDEEGANPDAVVKAILALGEALNLTVTAEGVETASQLAALRRERCLEAQGFLFARPMSLDELMALLVETKPLL